tara:strand:+ start:246 stop:425 length:180 start_codon:yes stop_codon:yes gene_type:complete
MAEYNQNLTPFKDAITGYKSLELSRALQDVKRLRSENSELKLEIIKMRKEQLQQTIVKG